MASNKQARGTKRTCQMAECGSRFYDLNRNPITCPICGSIYEIASSPLGAAAVYAEEKAAARKAKKQEVVDEDAAPLADGEEALAEIAGDDEPAAAEPDETFLEEEEEGGDVSGILGGPVAEGEEEP